jgi:hypothetical protein
MNTQTKTASPSSDESVPWQDYDPLLQQAAGLLIDSFLSFDSIDCTNEQKI